MNPFYTQTDFAELERYPEKSEILNMGVKSFFAPSLCFVLFLLIIRSLIRFKRDLMIDNRIFLLLGKIEETSQKQETVIQMIEFFYSEFFPESGLPQRIEPRGRF